MWTKSINLEVILICFLSLIPWPAPSVFKISCPRESARVVRKIVQSRWLPILEKYQVKIPLECPFHPLRDIFGPQQAAKKQNRPSQWTCGFCGKSFYDEKHLDMHFDARHSSIINSAEDAICLANYCDIMRCKVLLAKDATLSFGDSTISTDIEVWSEATAYRTAISTSGPRDLAKLPNRNFLPSLIRLQSDKLVDDDESSSENDEANVEKSEGVDERDGVGNGASGEKPDVNVSEDDDDSEESDSNATSSCEGMVDSSLPPADKKQKKLTEFQRMKANCKSEDLEKLKFKCEVLVRDCIAGLLIHLSNDDFKTMEDELNRAVCWYLTCDRYWEDGTADQRAFPWALVFILVLVLSLGVCFCYYIIWILFDSDDGGMTPPPMPIYMQSGHMSPTHHVHHHHLPPEQSHQSHYSSGSMTPILHPSHQSHLMSSSGMTASSSNHLLNAQSSNNAVSASVHQSSSRSTTPYPPDEFSEHYIYVTYPPELKRRLLESCYNRTTRL